MPETRTDFDTVYSLFYPRILRYLARMLGPDEAEDVSQEVFSKISRSLESFRGDASLATWIYRIATNAAMERVRSAGYRLSLKSAPADDLCQLEHAPAREAVVSPEREAIRTEMTQCVQGVLNGLPENDRTVLVLSEVEGFKNAEIAEVLGITLDAAKIRLHRARARLKKSLESQCSFYVDRNSTLLCDRKAPPES